MAVDVVSSSANPLMKDIRRAQEQGGLTSQGWLIAEGPHLLEEAVLSGLTIRCMVVSEDYRLEGDVGSGRTIVVPPHVFRSISGTQTPQGVMVLAEPPTYTPQDLYGEQALIVVLDGVQDPGNAGAIARSAEAFGASGLIFVEGSAAAMNPKTLRASAGSLFRVPFVRLTRKSIGLQVPSFCGVSERGASPWDCDLTGPCALVIGSEGGGVSDELRRGSKPVRIPTQGVESLNAGVAASVLLYEAARQRSAQ